MFGHQEKQPNLFPVFMKNRLKFRFIKCADWRYGKQAILKIRIQPEIQLSPSLKKFDKYSLILSPIRFIFHCLKKTRIMFGEPVIQRIVLFTFCLPVFFAYGQNKYEITVRPARDHYSSMPVSVTLKKIPKKFLEQGMLLEEIRGQQRIFVPSQVEKGPSPKLWWILSGNNSGSARTFELTAAGSPSLPVMQLRLDDTGLVIARGKSKALRYNYGLIPPPDSIPQMYARSGFIHPIWTPEGKVLTRIHPSDHIHHMGFWNPWTKTEFEGRQVDFWNLGEGEGTVRFLRFESLVSGPVFAAFSALQEFVDRSAPRGEKVALNEIWKVRVWRMPDTDRPIWIWDFTTTQWCASTSPLLLKKYRYGGFGFRGSSDWEKRNSDFLTSEGKTRLDGNGTRARWCNVFGKTDRGKAGILFLSLPQNHEYPEPMRIWPDGDVFFGFCPVFYSDWELNPGKKYVRKYRMVVYDGELSPAEAEDFWQGFAWQPKITVSIPQKIK